VSRVAIIGAGIAGMGCAWALHRSGAHVTVYERESEIGGNAKTHTWRVNDREIVTGLSVLAWPDALFHNYEALLAELDIAVETAPPIRFFIRDGESIYAHGLSTKGSERFAADLRRWERLVAFVRKVNGTFARGTSPSLYEYSPFNPLILFPLRRLATLFGISARFWERVFVPMHSSSFLSVELDALPASIAPSIEDILSIARGATLRTWSGASREVFARLSRGFEERIHRAATIVRVRRSRAGIAIEDQAGSVTRFDRVVFACNPHAALAMLESSSVLERTLLGGIEYADTTDPTFLRGVVHSDATVFPVEHRQAILDGFANFVELSEEDGRLRYENTFVLSSWVPAARGSGRPMLVSYHLRHPIETVERTLSNEMAHPCLSRSNLARAWLLRAIQGHASTYWCGAYSTPGNGHDLSLLSGLVVAKALGAEYPFARAPAAFADFQRLSSFMLG
jgi:predicted NAD/FAD-binding protein